jgi:Ca2+/Na+ antiporter
MVGSIVVGIIIGLLISIIAGDFQSVTQFMSTISAFASMLMVVVTGLYVFFTYKLVRETQEAREQDVAPVITFDLIDEKPVLVNVGNGPASQIEVTLSAEPDGISESIEIMNLASGEHQEIVGTPFYGHFQRGGDKDPDFDELRVTGSCVDGFGNERSIEWAFDVETIKEQQFLEVDSV